MESAVHGLTRARVSSLRAQPGLWICAYRRPSWVPYAPLHAAWLVVPRTTPHVRRGVGRRVSSCGWLLLFSLARGLHGVAVTSESFRYLIQGVPIQIIAFLDRLAAIPADNDD